MTADWHQNLVETKSKHTKTPIATFIGQLLGDFVSQRDFNDESNCICSDCLSRIYSYDWMLMKVKEQEKELRTLILKSEASYVATHIKSEFEFINPTELYHVDCNQGDFDDIKHELMDTYDNPYDNEEMKIVPDIAIENLTPNDEDDAEEWNDVGSDNDYDDSDNDDDDFADESDASKKKKPKKSTASTSNSKICEICGEKLQNVKTIQVNYIRKMN